MRKCILFLGLGLTAFGLVSCAAPKIRVTKLVSAKYYEAAKIKQVAVLPFDGASGDSFSAEIEATLYGINVGEKQFLTLVDRKKLDQVIQEMKFDRSAFVNPGTAAKIGNMAGAKGIYTGVVTAASVSDNPYKEQRSRCARNVTKYDKKGKPYEVCERYENYDIRCTKRVATFAFTPKLVAVETARVVYTNNIRGESNSSACSDSREPLVGKQQLFDQAKEIAKAKFRTDVAPHYIDIEVSLKNEADGIVSEDARRKLEQGLEYAKSNRMDRACELWGEAGQSSPNAPALLYDNALCAEIWGNLEASLDLYRQADRALGKPDADTSAALQRIGIDLREREKLKEQMK